MTKKKSYTKLDLERGTKIEMEHKRTIRRFLSKGVGVKTVAKSIAKDHLEEHPDYYKELVRMERKLNKKKR